LKEKIENREPLPLYAELDTYSSQEGIFKTTDPTSDDIEVVGGGSSWTGDHLHQLGVDLPNERIDLDADVIHTDQSPMPPGLQKRIFALFFCFDAVIGVDDAARELENVDMSSRAKAEYASLHSNYIIHNAPTFDTFFDNLLIVMRKQERKALPKAERLAKAHQHQEKQRASHIEQTVAQVEPIEPSLKRNQPSRSIDEGSAKRIKQDTDVSSVEPITPLEQMTFSVNPGHTNESLKTTKSGTTSETKGEIASRDLINEFVRTTLRYVFKEEFRKIEWQRNPRKTVELTKTFAPRYRLSDR